VRGWIWIVYPAAFLEAAVSCFFSPAEAALMTSAGACLAERPTADGILCVRIGEPLYVTMDRLMVVHGPVPFRGWLHEGTLPAA